MKKLCTKPELEKLRNEIHAGGATGFLPQKLMNQVSNDTISVLQAVSINSYDDYDNSKSFYVCELRYGNAADERIWLDVPIPFFHDLKDPDFDEIKRNQGVQ